ncbi:matrixin family metalloprotease [Streptomyces sp. NPDC056144]|uniref:matrixin family metalloprotease n=1 Tax=unclassified Streptomyces TaxID=2593676 RepID=UPI0035E2B4F6
MRTNVLGLAAASAAAVLLAVPAPPYAVSGVAQPYSCLEGEVDSRGRSSVDGSEITWDDESKFDDARKVAIGAWTSGTLNRVKIRADDATSYADVEWRDVNNSTHDWAGTYGRWDPNPGTDHLLMNRAYLDDGKRYGATEHRRRVAVHELGHALGFCHKDTKALSVMWEKYEDLDLMDTNKPTADDVKAYQALWGQS